MSLEAAIQENTTALRELLTHFTGMKAANEVATKKPDLKVVDTQPAKTEPVKTEAVKVEPVTASRSEPVKTLTFDEVRIPFVAMATKKGNAVVVELLAQFGVDATKGGKLSAIDSAHWPEVLVAIQKASS